jgi:hypothetical protein
MGSLAFRAWAELLYMDLVGAFGFQALHRVVKATRTHDAKTSRHSVAEIVKAMRTACLFYIKPARCLQRSAVVTRLLRRKGIPAELVIGCLPAPIESHAWVEVGGEVVSDYRPGLEHYRVLDRW